MLAIDFYPKSLVDRISRLRREYLTLDAPIIDLGRSISGVPDEKSLRDEDGVHLSISGSLVAADQMIAETITSP